MAAAVEEIDIVIVGGGICGLATALALHRKGIQSVVLERSDTLRSAGAAIGIFPNGWLALHQLGLDSSLRSTAVEIQSGVLVQADTGVEQRFRFCDGEARCIRRSDLIEALANALPPETIRFGCQVVSMNVEKSSSYAALQLQDGSLIRAKVLIGCDGANSVIANYIGLKPTRLFSKCSIRGLTIYPNGHGFAPEFLRVKKDKYQIGIFPVDDKSVYWFVSLLWIHQDADMPKDPASIRQLTLSITPGLPKNIVEMLENTDLSSLSFTRLRYRAPWNLLSGNFRRETVTVAGDAWHIMGPFLGQGGSAALEDGIVLARCLSKKIGDADLNGNKVPLSAQKAIEALDEYLKERRQRVILLSLLTYLRGLLFVADSSFLVRFLCFLITAAVFRDPLSHTRYNCGKL